MNAPLVMRIMKVTAALGLVFLLSALYLYSNWQNHSPQNSARRQSQTLEILDERPSLSPKVGNFLKEVIQNTENPTYIHFWAYWCQPCRDELPWLVSFIQDQPDAAKMNSVYLSIDESKKQRKKSRAFLREHNADHPYVYSPLNIELFREIGAQALPAHLFIDQKGRVAAFYNGSVLNQKERFKELWLQLLESSRKSRP